MAEPPIASPDMIQWFVRQQRWPNDVMYHYTSRVALHSILTKRHMWATDLKVMNDPEELRYGAKVINERLRRAARFRPNEVKTAFLRTFEESFWKVIAEPSTSFSISFSEHPDLPHQWLDYADGGTGFALGWSIDSECPESPLRMWVTYDRRRQQKLLDGLIAQHLEWMAALYKAGVAPQDAFVRAGMSLSRFVAAVWQTFKNSKWAPESEFRFVYQFFRGYEPPGQVFKSRFARGVEKQYIEADFSSVELRRIVIGPNNDIAATTSWLRKLLDDQGYESTEIVAPLLAL